jgi:ATP-binding protein involved in chromosome partitioning
MLNWLSKKSPEAGDAPTQDAVRAAVASVIDAHLNRSLVDTGAYRGAGIAERAITLDVLLDYPAAGYRAALEAALKAAVEPIAGGREVLVGIGSRVLAHRVQQALTPLPEVKNILAIASGKGGVGKSTTTTNLALALAAEGARVGILDADIYGPSQPRLLGLSGKPDSRDGRTLEPKVNFGVQTMSIGYMIDEDTAMIWRGPMVTQALQQMLNETRWDALDYLLIDLPPGTGDIQLTLCQRVPVSGALIVTTPQDLALLDARKALKMFEKVEVPVLGIVENMSTHVCSNCGFEEPIFGAGGGASMAAQYGVALLGQLPLDLRIREGSDSGRPIVVDAPESDLAQRYRHIARAAAARLGAQAANKKIAFPNIVIEGG